MTNRAPNYVIILASLTLLFTNVSNAQFERGLIAYWNFDKDLSDIAENLSPSSLANDQGRIVDATTTKLIIGGMFGKCLSSRGKTGGVKIKPSLDTLRHEDNTVSISLWFKGLNNQNQWATLISHGEGQQYRINFKRNTPFIGSSFGVSTNVMWYEKQPVLDNRWHHIVCVAENKVGTKMYLDGKLVVSSSPPSINKHGAYSGLNQLSIGDAEEAKDRAWNGLIDDVALWNRPLTSAEIKTIYNSGDGYPISELTGGFDFTKAAKSGSQTSKGQSGSTYRGVLTEFSGPTEIHLGDEIALIVEKSVETVYDRKIMTQISKDLEKIAKEMRHNLLSKSKIHRPYKDKVRFEFSNSVRGGVSSSGQAGIALSKKRFDQMYSSYEKGNPILPYELMVHMAHSYWTDELEKPVVYSSIKGNRSHTHWQDAHIKVAAVLIPTETGFTISRQEEVTTLWEQLQQTYRNNDDTTWHQTFLHSNPESIQGEALKELLSGLLYELCLKHGKKSFFRRYLSNLKEMKPLRTYHQHSNARNNFAVATSLAAGTSLEKEFNGPLKWPVSKNKLKSALKGL